MIIKITKDGRKVELLGEQICLDGKPHADTISPIIPMMRDKAKAVMPDAEYFAGQILLTKEQGEKALAELDSRRRARRMAEKEKLDQAIPGLDALRAARAEEENYHENFARMMEDEHNDGARPPRRPATDAAKIAMQYPRAAAYLKAEAYSRAAHDRKAGAGRKAMELLSSGGAIDEAEAILANWLPASAIWD